jgi:ATP-dependent helicase HrpB
MPIQGGQKFGPFLWVLLGALWNWTVCDGLSSLNHPIITLQRKGCPLRILNTLALAALPERHVDAALDALRCQSQLPIFDILKKARQSLQDRPNLLLEAPPGAGKTTVLPLALLTQVSLWSTKEDDEAKPIGENQSKHNEPLPQILVVEPRRVAARSAAQRMASILQQSTGQTVGYAFRGEARISPETTQIIVVTEGVLLNRLRQDPSLKGVNAIIFDEFHERGVGSDTALALCVEIQRSLRSDLRIVVMSATLFQEQKDQNDNNDKNSTKSKLLDTLGGEATCKVLVSDGRQFPIVVQWARKGYPPLGVLMKSRNDLVSTMCQAIEEALRLAPAKGDVLVFLPGAREIERVVEELKARRVAAEVLPLYGSLPKDKQDYALYPSFASDRRVIVASPIAEASLTLERVTCVVDSGLRREPRCDTDTGMPRLVTTRCSKASARQRAGRAGRIQEGLCLRIYPESEFNRFVDHSPPEVLNTDIVPSLVILSDWGCLSPAEIYEIPFVDSPEGESLKKAYDTLVSLEVLEETDDDRYRFTDLGQSIVPLPMHPRLAVAVTRANTPEQLAAAVISSSFLDDDTDYKGEKEPNLVTRIRTLLEGPDSSVRLKSVLQYASRISEEAVETVLYFMENKSEMRNVLDVTGESLLPGFIDLVAERKADASYGGSTYMLSLGRSARLDDTRDSPEYVVVTETTTGDDGIARIRSYASISSEALHRVATEREVVFTVPSRGHEVRARRSMMVGSLELSSTPMPAPPSDEVSKILLDTIRELGGVYVALLQKLPKDKRAEVEELRERVRLAVSLDSTSSWPPYFAAMDAIDKDMGTPGDSKLLEELVEPWLAPAGSLKGISLFDILARSLTSEQIIRLDKDYPEMIEAPDGSRIPVHYSSGVPTASAKLQQFFGQTESPSVGPRNNRIPVALKLLSPAGKELAQTIDLPFFWSATYPQVRAEMRGRYAKHPWPENPMEATPSRQTKKQQASVANGIVEPTAASTKKMGGKSGKRHR